MIERYAYASRAIIGGRDYQEDYCLADFIGFAGRPEGSDHQRSERTLAVVLADGMGGHVGGAEASRLACQAFLHSCKTSLEIGRERLNNAVMFANEYLRQAVLANPTLDTMGCTLVGAIFDPRGVEWASVGDSHLLLYRDNVLIKLNEDHSMAPVLDDLAARGLMDRREAKTSPRRHQLRSAMTGQAIDMVDLSKSVMPLQANDWVIMASDGLDSLTDSDLAELLGRNKMGSADTIAQAIVDAVCEIGEPYQDNTTVIAVHRNLMPGEETASLDNHTPRTVPLTARGRP